MTGTATLANYGRGGGCGENRKALFGLFQALAKGLRRILERSDNGRVERRATAGAQPARDTRVVNAMGSLCDTRLLEGFHRRCEQALSPGRRCVVVDLSGVTSVNTKLVATLVTLLRRAQAEGGPPQTQGLRPGASLDRGLWC
jgi:anti-anti-sigma regulatory factor